MTTLKQWRLRCLIFGYVKSNYVDNIPAEIIKIIQLLYDEHFYWKIQGDEMQKFLNTKNGQILYNKSTLTIKNIEFEFRLFPNGRKKNSMGFVHLCFLVKTMPSDIEQFILYLELSCDTFQSESKSIAIGTNNTRRSNRLCMLSQCKNLNEIEFSCLVKMLHIRYKQDKENQKTHFETPIKMSKYTEYEWIIDDKEQIERIRNMDVGFGECSDNIDNNNWVIRVKPKGFSRIPKYPGKMAIQILCLAVPFGIKSMDVEYSIQLSDGEKVIQMGQYVTRLMFVRNITSVYMNNRMSMECPDVDVNELFDGRWIRIKVSIVIFDIYDMNEDKIEKNQWQTYGILV